MRLGEANKLLLPFFKHPGFRDFRKKTPRIQKLTIQIRKAIQKTDLNHHLGTRFVEIDEETEKAFREFAEICKKGLK